MKKRNVIIISCIVVILVIAGCLYFALNQKTGGNEYSEAELTEKLEAIVKPYYDSMAEVSTTGDGYGRFYTDHKYDHAKMVGEKSGEMGDTINSAIETGLLDSTSDGDTVGFGAVDKKILLGASLSHDMGMCGQGYALTEEKDESGETVRDENGNVVYAMTEDGLYQMHKITFDSFAEIRTSHSLNSGLIILINREKYKAIGYSDQDVDEMAIACMAHSKSNSGVKNLNSYSNWVVCFDRMDSLVAAYNADNTDATISFDRKPFEEDIDKLSCVASETLALRVADVSRDSGPDAEVQSGEHVHVDRDTVDDKGGSIEAEVENAKVYSIETGDVMTDTKNKQVHIGEQNITDNHTVITNDEITHIITVNELCSGPKCTQQAIEDHLGEFYSAREGSFVFEVEFTDSEGDDVAFFQESYDDFRIEMAQTYTNVSIRYPWDE